MQEVQRELVSSEIKTKKLKVLENKFFYDLFKRIFDLVSSLCGLIVFSPLFLIIAMLIKLDSKGPAFFSHIRLGKQGEKIKVYKFRTMKPNAEELLKNLTPEQKREFQENFKLEDDPRITKIGSFLRKSSLDELPQLLNIFIGNMTVVGPRPIVGKEIEKYGEYGDKLLMVKPGLTGMWQANGRSDTTYEERVEMDMDYIDNRNFWLDIKIIFQTAIAVVRKKGAK
ncbi:bacterial sugar transferase [Clostridium sporogenes]|uniref:sugar transferase n=1 Tax=Clostridium botulinum TaxID=1491 RepID=UPI0007179E0C|nr:sugar transferase [Clostridium botulinum]KRU25372.1 bacterial sugar transferase [Clostridium sporogenes]KRU28622.1 bacterial sugar transferase [Clostridium sporogenes]KRU32741.1 bacterial sugar transferase [Clostridium sporogenes]KRU47514.1 bacterial sugar transferase [Clostridium sporogenes]MBZ1327874.1 sugar transferase [Clostridium botulinum]